MAVGDKILFCLLLMQLADDSAAAADILEVAQHDGCVEGVERDQAIAAVFLEISVAVQNKDAKLADLYRVSVFYEKHVPVVTVEGEDVTARVGAVDHPMLDVHYIEWIAFADGTKIGIKFLNPGDAPEATFTKTAETGTVYAYCNLHGLWKTEL